MPFDLEHDDELVRRVDDGRSAGSSGESDERNELDEPLHIQPVRLRMMLATDDEAERDEK